MEIKDQLTEFINRIDSIKENIETEEATKTSMIMPFFQMLGYDVFNPLEFVPEYTADVGIKKGEKVDYAIMMNGEPVIVVECKPCNSNLEKHTSQLFRYFGVTAAKFAILTNGIEYKFYTDLEEANKMDASPFLSINLLNLKDRDVTELLKFSKGNLDVDQILSSAENLKYVRLIKNWLVKELKDPSADFERLILNDVYDGVKTQKVIDEFEPIVKKAIQQYINDILNDKLKLALNSNGDSEDSTDLTALDDNSDIHEKENKIETTIEELEAYAIIKSILRDAIDVERIFYRDTQSYFGILLDDNNRKWICRIYLNSSHKSFTLPDENKKEIRTYIDSIDDLYNHKEEILEVCKKYM